MSHGDYHPSSSQQIDAALYHSTAVLESIAANRTRANAPNLRNQVEQEMFIERGFIAFAFALYSIVGLP